LPAFDIVLLFHPKYRLTWRLIVTMGEVEDNSRDDGPVRPTYVKGVAKQVPQPISSRPRKRRCLSACGDYIAHALWWTLIIDQWTILATSA